MTETSVSLLDRLADDPDADSWQQLADLYTPLLRQWLRRYDVQDSDADDLIQEVLLVVAREIPSFRHNQRQGAFRNWLRTIVVNRLRNFWRSRKHRPHVIGSSSFAEQLDQLKDDGSGLSRIWNDEHDRHVIGRLLELSQTKFTAGTWQAFRRLMIDGADAETVADELDMSPNAVYIAKSRVLTALRQDAAGLVD